MQTEDERRQRICPPIYVSIVNTEITEEDLNKVSEDFKDSLARALKYGEKIPYNDAGCERVQQMFKDSYDRVLAGKHQPVTISVIIEK